MDIDRKQRTDIDTVTNDRLTLAIDEGNIIESPYVQETIESFVGNNWIITDNVYVKYNLVEDDTIIFNYEAITELAQKDITKVTVSFDYLVENIINVLPVLTNVSLNHSMITYKTVDLSLSDEGHVDIDCSLFDIDNEVLNTIISSQGFGIGLSFNGKLSNVTLKLSNVKVKFKFDDKLLPESNSVVNRLEPYIDFYRDGDNLILQVGGDASGKGMDRGGSNTYTKEEIDNKLAAKVNTQVGKMLSSNDYTNDEKTKLSGIEANANYYIHPFTHDSSIIVNSDALTNLDTSANASQSAINAAIDGAIGDKQDKLTSGENIKTINNESVLGSGNITIQGGSNVDIATSWGSTTSDSKVPSEKLAKNSLDDKISKSSTSGLVKNDGTIDTTTYSTFSGSYNDLSNKPSIPSSSSDLSDGSDLVKKSSTSGLIKNNGTIDTTSYLPNAINSSVVDVSPSDNILITDTSDSNKVKRVGNIVTTQVKELNVYGNIGNSSNDTQSTINGKIDDVLGNKISKSSTSGLVRNNGSIDTTSYSTFSGSYDDLSDTPTIPSASSTTPSADTENGSYGSGTDYARSNHTHPKSNLYAESSHTHNKSQITDFPSIPSSSSDLSDGSDLIKKSNTDGLVKNDGSIDTRSYQNKLYSGQNIKTINHESILGYGNLNVGGGYSTTYFDACNDSANITNYTKTGSANMSIQTTGDDYYYLYLTSNNVVSWNVTNITVSNKVRISADIYMGANVKPRLFIYNPTLQNGLCAMINQSSEMLVIAVHTLNSFGHICDMDSLATSLNTWYKLEFIIDEELLTYNLYDSNGTLLKSFYGYDELGLSSTGNLVGFGLDGNSAQYGYIRNFRVENWDEDGSSVDIVTSWETIPSDNKVASEKLVKNSLEGKISKSSTNGLVKNDGSIDTNTYLTQHQSLTDYVQKNNGANTMTDSSAYSTIGTSANATQKTINAAIDSKLDDIYDTFLCENLLFDESDLLGGS